MVVLALLFGGTGWLLFGRHSSHPGAAETATAPPSTFTSLQAQKGASVQVPTVVGQGVDTVQAALANVGLVLGSWTPPPGPTSTSDTVTSTFPPAGTVVAPGSKVTIHWARGG